MRAFAGMLLMEYFVKYAKLDVPDFEDKAVRAAASKAAALDFPAGADDTALLCWLLEGDGSVLVAGSVAFQAYEERQRQRGGQDQHIANASPAGQDDEQD